MWCSHCRQDVPGISSAKTGQTICARCAGELLRDGPHDAPLMAGLSGAADNGLDLTAARWPDDASPSFEDWQTDQSLRQLQARVGNWKRSRRAPGDVDRRARQPGSGAQRRIDGPHAAVAQPHSRLAGAGRLVFVFWTTLSLGLTAFAAGSILGWSFAEGRPELWNFGFSLMVAGQAGLLLALVLQLDPIGQYGRSANAKLDRVDSHLKDLKRSTAMLGVTHGSAAQAFYAHMSDQANPELLVADLKGQLDLLALSMAKRSA